jgi:hypothetical protein
MKTTTTRRASAADQILAGLNLVLTAKGSAFRASGDLKRVTFTAGHVARFAAVSVSGGYRVETYTLGSNGEHVATVAGPLYIGAVAAVSAIIDRLDVSAVAA